MPTSRSRRSAAAARRARASRRTPRASSARERRLGRGRARRRRWCVPAARVTSRSVWGNSRFRSNTIRRSGCRGAGVPRAVSAGSSARAVPSPTATASNPARSQWTYCARLLARDPPRASRPRRRSGNPDWWPASTRRRDATSTRTRCRNAAFCAAASLGQEPHARPRPPRLGARSAPPAATGFGSSSAITTRRMPAARIASVHGGVWPWWAQGSSVTTQRRAARAVARGGQRHGFRVRGAVLGVPTLHPPPRRPAARRRPPAGSGATRPQPRQARSRARAIAARSSKR